MTSMAAFVPALRIPDRFSPDEQALIREALLFAAEAHRTQKRKGAEGAPYIVHPAAAAELLMHEMGADAQTAAAGLLHDTVEDTAVRLDDIEREFGPQIRFLVDGATDYGENDGNPHIPDKLERAKHSREKALRYAQQDPRVLLVKIADRWDNMKTVHVHTPRGQIGYSRSTLEFHVVKARALGLTKAADELERLAKGTIARWEAYGPLP